MSKKIEFNAYVHGLADGNIVISNRLDKLGKKSIPIQFVEFEMYGGQNSTLALIRVPDYIAYGMGFVTPQVTAAPAQQRVGDIDQSLSNSVARTAERRHQLSRDRSTEQPTREEQRQVAAVEQALSDLTLDEDHHAEAVAEPSKSEVRSFLSRFQVPMGRVRAETKDL